jgi:hypothetical protein
MRRLAFLAAVACLWGCALPGTGRADIITFDNLNINPLTGSHTEGAFTYTVVSGSAWDIVNSLGNPASALTTGFFAVPNVGDEIDFFLTGGGLFTFDSFDFASTSDGSQSDSVNLFGEVGGVQTQQLLDISSTSGTWQTNMPGFSAPIDTLRLVIASAGDTDLALDNFVLTPAPSAVPEPASLTLLGLGAAGLLGYGWRRRRRATA